MVPFSVCIITLNEARNIGRCIESVKDIAGEVVVVDSYSTDQTLEICRNYGARVILNPFGGHIQQKNFALAQARHNWVLSLDADEALSEKLRDSIREVMKNPAADGYTMNRMTNYCGKWIRHGGWYPDTKLRLVKKDQSRWQGINPHDILGMDPGCRLRKLRGDILHYSYYTLEEHLRQIDAFTAISAKELAARQYSPGIWPLYVHPAFRFFRDYFLRMGLRDGYAGYQIARLTAYATFLKYARTRALIRRKESEGEI